MVNCLFAPISIPVSWGIALCSTVGYLGSSIFSLFRERDNSFDYPGLENHDIENLMSSESDEFDQLYRLYLKPTYFGVAYTEDNSPQAISSDYGTYEFEDRYAITFINGIGVSLKSAKKYGNYIADLTGKKVTIIHNPNLGFFRNLWRYIQEIFCSRVTPSAILLAKQWRSKMAENKKIIHIAHSEGCAITKLARTLLTPHERENLYIIAVAPGGYIPKDDFCPEVVHYVSPLDPIPHFDTEGRLRAIEEGTFKTLMPMVDKIEWIFHKFFHFDYQDPIIQSIEEFKKCILSPSPETIV